MTKPTITYEITNTTEYPDGGKLVFLTLTRTEKINTSEGEQTNTYVRGTTLYIKPGQDIVESINTFLLGTPV